MPKKITAYACKFSCGHRVTTKKKSIENHEKICFGNPERRACKTCKYHEFDMDGNYCIKEEKNIDFTPPEMFEKKGLCFNCPGWEVDNGPE